MSENPWNAIFGRREPARMVDQSSALPGRDFPVLPSPGHHAVLGTPIAPPWPEGIEVIYLALGCFWGAEKVFWQLDGVYTTAVGYQGGITPNPTYEEVCTGRTGHAETVLVAFDPARVEAAAILRTFWEVHDPTQGFRQGNDVGTQYRSAVYYTSEAQAELTEQTGRTFAERLAQAGFGAITTEIRGAADAGPFYYAEDYHQQYLAKNPNGYCPVHATGVSCG